MYQGDSFKIFVSIRRDLEHDIEYKKMILMVQGNQFIQNTPQKIIKI